ncbi:MAG: HNH endonuclease, partial [Desulfuromonadaceae bacterium]
MDEYPPAIRILPMANNLQDEFPGCESIEDVQQKFFLDELAYRENGSYNFHKRGLQAEPGTIVLFQCQARIIASATLAGTERFEKPAEGDYDGCLKFDVATIRTFESIKPDTIQQIWPNFKGFSHVRWELDPKNYHEFEKLLTHVKQPEISKPTQEACDLISPPERVHESIYRILRDSELARRVKIFHDFKCQICGHTIKIPNGGSYAESHHIQPLGQPHNGPDTIGNIICLCPNHHAELDYGVSA